MGNVCVCLLDCLLTFAKVVVVVEKKSFRFMCSRTIGRKREEGERKK